MGGCSREEGKNLEFGVWRGGHHGEGNCTDRLSLTERRLGSAGIDVQHAHRAHRRRGGRRDGRKGRRRFRVPWRVRSILTTVFEMLNFRWHVSAGGADTVGICGWPPAFYTLPLTGCSRRYRRYKHLWQPWPTTPTCRSVRKRSLMRLLVPTASRRWRTSRRCLTFLLWSRSACDGEA